MRTPKDSRPVAGLAGAERSVGVVSGDAWRRRRLAHALEAAGLECGPTVSSLQELTDAAPELSVTVLYGDPQAREYLGSIREARSVLPLAVGLVAVCPVWNISGARRILRVGADGVVLEGELERMLGPAIRAVQSGLVCLPRSMRAPVEADSLSMRERQVLRLLAQGFTNAEIGARLFLAESTVKSHLSTAYNKLGVQSRKEAATMILDPAVGLGISMGQRSSGEDRAANRTTHGSSRVASPVGSADA